MLKRGEPFCALLNFSRERLVRSQSRRASLDFFEFVSNLVDKLEISLYQVEGLYLSQLPIKGNQAPFYLANVFRCLFMFVSLLLPQIENLRFKSFDSQILSLRNFLFLLQLLLLSRNLIRVGLGPSNLCRNLLSLLLDNSLCFEEFVIYDFDICF